MFQAQLRYLQTMRSPLDPIVLASLMLSSALICLSTTGCWLNDDATDDDSTSDEWPDLDDDDDTGPQGAGTLTNSPDYCYDPGYLYPNSTDVGFFAAVKLSPEGYPFSVRSIRYLLEGGSAGSVTCRPDLGHRMRLYVDSSSSPPADDLPVFELEIPDNPGDLSDRTIFEHIYPEIEITSGQYLFVAIEMVGENPELLCLSLCYDPPVESSGSWWSHAAEPPFAWGTLEADGVDADIFVEADGTYF